jgi:hypothetical protein
MTLGDELEIFKAGMRKQQSTGPLWTIGGGRRLGAYGFDPEAYESMVREAGYAGAPASDRQAQEKVVDVKFAQDFMEFNNWMLTAISWEYGHDLAVAFQEKGAFTPEAIIGLGYEKIGNWAKELGKQLAFGGSEFTDAGVDRFYGLEGLRSPTRGARSFTLPEMQFVEEQEAPADPPPTYDRAATQLRSILTGMRNAGKTRSVRTATGIETQEVGE